MQICKALNEPKKKTEDKKKQIWIIFTLTAVHLFQTNISIAHCEKYYLLTHSLGYSFFLSINCTVFRVALLQVIMNFTNLNYQRSGHQEYYFINFIDRPEQNTIFL